MFYKKEKPDVALAPFVECYYSWQGFFEKERIIQSPPTSFCAIVFNFGDPYFAKQGETNPITVPQSFVSGQFTSNYQLILKGNINMVGIVFRPSALFNFFALPMPGLTNNRVDINLVLPQLNTLQERLKNQQENIKSIIDDFLLAQLPQATKKFSFVDQAIEWIDNQNGTCTVDDLALRLRVSRRHLEKKFLEKTGVSPKFYARLKRFSILSNLVIHQNKPDWQELLFNAGFHDQSHLIKEYLEFNRMTPSEYFKNNQELARLND